MLLVFGVVEQVHQALFHGEVDVGVFDQSIEDGRRVLGRVVLDDRRVQLVERVDRHAVLFIDPLDAHAERVTPFGRGVRLADAAVHVGPPRWDMRTPGARIDPSLERRRPLAGRIHDRDHPPRVVAGSVPGHVGGHCPPTAPRDSQFLA